MFGFYNILNATKLHINKRIGFATQTTRKGGLSKNWIVPYVVEDVLEKGTCRLKGLKNAVNSCRLNCM